MDATHAEFQSLRVMIVEPSRIFASGLEVLLKQRNMSVTGIAFNQTEALKLARANGVSVALVAIQLAVINGHTVTYEHGLQTIRDLKSIKPTLCILALDRGPEPHWSVEALRTGASGLIPRDSDPEFIVDALRLVAQGGVILTRKHLDQLISPRPSTPADLTQRERAVLECLVTGKSNREIADELTVSVGTVRTHVSNILSKLAVRTRKEAATEAVRRGLVERD